MINIFYKNWFINTICDFLGATETLNNLEKASPPKVKKLIQKNRTYIELANLIEQSYNVHAVHPHEEWRSLWLKLKHSKVILIGESHSCEEHSRLFSRIVIALWPLKSHTLFVECTISARGSPILSNNLPSEIILNSRNWDSQSITLPIGRKLISTYRFMLISFSFFLKMRDEQKFLLEKTPQDIELIRATFESYITSYAEIFQKYPLSEAERTPVNPPEIVSFQLKIATILLFYFRDETEAIKKLTDSSMERRDKGLVDKIVDNMEKEAKSPIVFAGNFHVNGGSNTVKMLTTKQISAVSLTPKTTIFPYLENQTASTPLRDQIINFDPSLRFTMREYYAWKNILNVVHAREIQDLRNTIAQQSQK